MSEDDPFEIPPFLRRVETDEERANRERWCRANKQGGRKLIMPRAERRSVEDGDTGSEQGGSGGVPDPVVESGQ